MSTHKEQQELIHRTIGFANNVAYDYGMKVEITEEGADFVKIRSVTDEGETDVTATVKYLGDFTHEDKGVLITSSLLGVWVNSDGERWRIIDARAISLFALLYV